MNKNMWNNSPVSHDGIPGVEPHAAPDAQMGR